MGALGWRSRRAFCVAALAVVAALPLVVTDRFLLKVLHVRGHERARRHRARAAVRLRGADLARPRGVRGHRRLHVRVPHGATRAAVARRRSRRRARVAALGGLVLALPSLRLQGHYLAMATLGFGELVFLAVRRGSADHRRRERLHRASRSQPSARSSCGSRRNLLARVGRHRRRAAARGEHGALRPGRAMRALHGSELGAHRVRRRRRRAQGARLRRSPRRLPASRARCTPRSSASSRRRCSPFRRRSCSWPWRSSAARARSPGPVGGRRAAHAAAVPRRAHPGPAARDRHSWSSRSSPTSTASRSSSSCSSLRAASARSSRRGSRGGGRRDDTPAGQRRHQAFRRP